MLNLHQLLLNIIGYMKKLSCLFVMLLLTVLAKAQNANAIIYAENGEKFTVILNEVTQNEKPETSVKMKNLNDPQYKMKIVFEDARLGETSFNLFLEPDVERTFSLSKNSKGKYVLRFISGVPINNSPDTLAVNQAVIKNENLLLVKDVSTVLDVDSSVVKNADAKANASKNNSLPSNSDTIKQANMPIYSGVVGCENPMSNADFKVLKDSIPVNSFEETKLSTAKELVKNQCMLSQQIKELASLFTFDETRLDFAKFAYNYTYDRTNYYKVNDVFTFESSVEELNDFIKNQY